MKRVNVGLVSNVYTKGLVMEISTLIPKELAGPSHTLPPWMHNAQVFLEFREETDRELLAALEKAALDRVTIDFTAGATHTVDAPNLREALLAAFREGYRNGVTDANVTLRPEAALREDEVQRILRATQAIATTLGEAQKRTKLT